MSLTARFTRNFGSPGSHAEGVRRSPFRLDPAALARPCFRSATSISTDADGALVCAEFEHDRAQALATSRLAASARVVVEATGEFRVGGRKPD